MGHRRTANLSRDKVIEAALQVAAAEGINAVTMRRVGRELGVEAMSLYTYISSKHHLLTEMVRDRYDDKLADLLAEDATSPSPPVRSLAVSCTGVLIAHATVKEDAWTLMDAVTTALSGIEEVNS